MNDLKNCPHCSAPNDTAINPAEPDAVPHTGDLTICLYCTGVAVYIDDNQNKRAATSDEVANLNAEIAKHPIFEAYLKHLKSHFN